MTTRRAAAAMELADPRDLPAIDGDAITIAWDSTRSVTPCTVLGHGDREIWREDACWEGIDRFDEVVASLQASYGSRLVAVEPSRSSQM